MKQKRLVSIRIMILSAGDLRSVSGAKKPRLITIGFFVVLTTSIIPTAIGILQRETLYIVFHKLH